MKLFELTKNEFLQNAEEAIEYFNEEMNEMFPEKNWIAKAHMSKSLGPSINYSFADREWNVTIQNSKRHLSFMMHLTTRYGKVPESADKFSIEVLQRAYQLRDAGVNPRKITGKSPMDATKKLVQWFRKNKDNIINLKKKNLEK